MLSVASSYFSSTLLEEGPSLRPHPLQGQAAEPVTPAWLPWQPELQLQARLRNVVPTPPPQLIALCKVAKCESLSKEMGTSCYCERLEMLKKGEQPNEVSCQKSTVQRVIWENMTTLERQGVIMASQ